MSSKYYSGFVMDSDISDKTGIVLNTTDAELIAENIKRIIMTRKGERIHNSSFGSDIKKSIFSSSENINEILSEVSSVLQGDSRYTVKNVSLEASREEEYYITITVVINSSGETLSVTSEV